MKRRKFITLLGGAATWPLTARAQQPKVPTIGALVIGNINPEQFWREFRQGLHDLGYVEGQNIRFEFRSAGFCTLFRFEARTGGAVTCGNAARLLRIR